MEKLKSKIEKFLKEEKVEDKEIEKFFKFHEEGLKTMKEELEKMKDEEVKSVVGGMLVVYQLTNKAKENEKNPLMGMLLFNMLNNIR